MIKEVRSQKPEARSQKPEVRSQKSEARKIKRRFFLLFFICHLSSVICYLLSVSGCGYTTRSMLSNEYKTIYITPFVNKIDFTNEEYAANKYKVYRPLLETEITRAAADKFMFDGSLKPVSRENADLILKGELVEFRRDPLRYTDNDDVYEYRLNLLVNISLLDSRQDKLVWQESNFTGDTSYFVSGSQAVSEDTAVSNAIKDLARRIVERTVEQW